ncbi:MAG: TonB-dependent receptor [Xanthomonadales bacterium]|nr:TonB-dependent receptor [Xanthomonadales bacterium]
MSTSWLLVPVLVAGSTTDSWAQDSDGAVIEEIVVTAQKREQVAQTVPVSLFAITNEDLEKAGVYDLTSLDEIAAGVTVSEANPDQFNVVIRGISNLGGNFIAGPATGVYLDESPMSAFSSALPQMAFWDAERVEVLRGPQGTLFGEGSMGGTIRVISAKPDASGFSGRIQAGWSSVSGGDDAFSGKAMLNVPLVEDTLALRFNASVDELPGWIDVPDLGATNANSGDRSSYRAALRWTPSDELTVDLSYMQQDVEIDNNFFATSPGVYRPADIDPALGPVVMLSARDSEFDLVNLTASYDFGPVTLVAALSDFNSEFSEFGDRSYVVPVFFGFPGTAFSPFTTIVEAETQELRLVSNGDNTLNWTAGFYNKSDDRANPNSGFVFDIPFLVDLIGTSVDEALTTATSSNDAQALYGDVEWKISDAFALQAGARYYDADYEQVTRFDTTSLLLGTVAGVVSGSGSSDVTNGKLGASWSPTDTVMLYARYSEGFRDGGVNPNAQPSRPEIPADFSSEEIKAYEVGVKSNPRDWLQLNASVYSNEWDQLQLGFVTSDGLLGYTANAGQASADGAEIELLARPTSQFQVGLNLAWLDSEIDEQVENAFGIVIAQAGNEIPFSPDLQALLSASYQFPISGNLNGNLAMNFAHRGESFSEPENRESEINDSLNTVYLQAGVSGENWSANLYVRNATDEDVTNIRGRFVTALPYVFGSYVEPRSVGVQFNMAF